MKINKRHLSIGFFALMVIMVICGYLYLNPSHRNIQEEEISYRGTASELEESFKKSDPKTKIADQVIQTEGRITDLGEKSLTLDGKVEINFIEKLPVSIEIGGEVIVKGRCVGYDDLLEMVKVDQAILVK